MPVLKKYKVCRRMGVGIYEKCQTKQFADSLERVRSNKKSAPKRQSDFAKQHLEKQKARFMYGVSEKQFSGYVFEALEKAMKHKSTPALYVFQKLETRLDNTVYRMGLAKSRRMSRQLVSHGHVNVNGRKLTVPSYIVRQDDIIEIREGSKSSKLFLEIEEILKAYKTPQWVLWDAKFKQAKIQGLPTDPDPLLNFQAVIEYYSR